MEPIQETLKKIGGKKNAEMVRNHVRAAVENHKEVQQFLRRHPGADQSVVQKSLAQLYEFTSQTRGCAKCPSLSKCVNIIQGHQPRLVFHQRRIEVTYEKCPTLLREEQKQQQARLFRGLYISKEMEKANMADVDLEEKGRLEAVEKADSYIERFVPGKTADGLYFYGDFGVGKSYLLAAVANELARRKNVRSLMVYVPDFFREMKAAIGDQSVSEKLQYIKSVPLLILDDIGAETVTSWVRDDLLGSILQYRMTEKLPTLYTSNFNYDQLEEHLAYSQKSGIEQLKAKRIMERIRHLTVAVKVEGANQRHRRL